MLNALRILIKNGSVLLFILLQLLCFYWIVKYNQNQSKIYFYSKQLIAMNDYVMGMNYGILSDIKYDLYFIEQGLCDDQELRLRIKIIDELLISGNINLYFKNIYGPKGLKYVVDNYGERVKFLSSYSLFCSNKYLLRYVSRIL